MDEKIIYIIFIIAWGIYSYYRKSQKRKSQQSSDHSQQKGFTFPKGETFIKMLLGEEFVELPKTMDNGQLTIDDGKKNQITIKQQTPEPVVSNQTSYISTETSKVLETFEVHKTKRFDLRQAIIYNVLLEKKFDK